MLPRPILEVASSIAVLLTAALLTAVPFGPTLPERNPQIDDGLSLLRTAVYRFALDHGERELSTCSFGGDLEARLLGEVASDGFLAAPYLGYLPENPVNGRSSIRLVAKGQPVMLNGSAGWVYVSETASIHPDLPGRDDVGTAFLDY